MPQSDGYSASWIPTPGDLLDERYEVQGRLNEGGMGIILRAHDSVRDEMVAIKLVSPKHARTGDFSGRFEREVTLATSIEHPNVIRCYDHGKTDAGALYLVMELLDGFALREVIRNEGRLSTKRAVNLTLQILSGLGAAHDRGIVHRDLKPSNLYVVETEAGENLKLLDFGLAKSLEDERVRLTKTGMICGTAAYVAPETLVVESPDERADVYAVGLIMLEMLFGRRVYPSKQMAQTFMEQLVIPAKIPRRVWDQPVGRIIARALQKHPGERFANAHQMYKALEATVGTNEDFVLGSKEIPPGANELPRELLDDLADGRYRTIDTLHRLPVPTPWDPGSEDAARDRELLAAVLDEISRSDIHAAFDSIVAGATSPAGEPEDAPPAEVPASEPVELAQESSASEAQDEKSHGLWPYLLALGLIVACLILWLLLRPTSP